MRSAYQSALRAAAAAAAAAAQVNGARRGMRSSRLTRQATVQLCVCEGVTPLAFVSAESFDSFAH